jgi:hypothetical protein
LSLTRAARPASVDSLVAAGPRECLLQFGEQREANAALLLDGTELADRRLKVGACARRALAPGSRRASCLAGAGLAPSPRRAAR